jgi:hypothetical protein
MSERIVLARIGSSALMVDAESGRLDLWMQTEGVLSPSQMRQIGLTVMFDDLDQFERTITSALRIAKGKKR